MGERVEPCFYLALWSISNCRWTEDCNRHVQQCEYCQVRVRPMMDVINIMARSQMESLEEEKGTQVRLQ